MQTPLVFTPLFFLCSSKTFHLPFENKQMNNFGFMCISWKERRWITHNFTKRQKKWEKACGLFSLSCNNKQPPLYCQLEFLCISRLNHFPKFINLHFNGLNLHLSGAGFIRFRWINKMGIKIFISAFSLGGSTGRRWKLKTKQKVLKQCVFKIIETCFK